MYPLGTLTGDSKQRGQSRGGMGQSDAAPGQAGPARSIR